MSDPTTQATTTDAPPFDVLGPLPTGVTVLEASAGTGKTYTIAALAARYVADGLPLERLLVVTFTRAATSELRERVRDRLVSTERALDAVVTGDTSPIDDEVTRLLAEGTPADVRERRDRLARAVADFDAATITTTHGFCLEVLDGLGFAGDIERDTRFAEDIRDLTTEVVDDFYVRRFRAHTPAFGRKEAGAIVDAAVANPAAHLEPSDPPDGSVPAMRVGLACRAREELERRKRLAAVMTYDDLLTRLNDTLKGPGGADVAARLSTRFRVVLVDEFQDTDPVQWEIMRRAFGEAGSTLVLIGDPKQAIYAFRGADVYAYLEAAASAVQRATLTTNRRSDQPLLTAYDALFARSQLGHEGILYRDTASAPANVTTRLSGAPDPSPLRVRVVRRGPPAVKLTKYGYAVTGDARDHIAQDLAADVVVLLNSGATIETRAEDGTVRGTAPVAPGDVAVLVRTRRQATLVRDALDALHVPAVINGAGSVFASDAAEDWLTLLQALERPTSTLRARGAALTPFLGWSAARLAASDDDDLEELHARLHEWAEVLRTRGVASLAATITAAQGLPARMLAFDDGERELTDQRHVAQLLHAVAMSDHLGTSALTAWLRRRIAEAGDEGDEQRIRRLESDAAAVQILTIHGSKGLEFPIVYCPFLWESGWIKPGAQPVFFHDPQHGDRRTLDVGLEGPEFAQHQTRHRVELRGEDLRLAYVALTRARHQAVIWWAGSSDCRHSPLSRLLWDRDEHGAVHADGKAKTRSDEDAFARFEELAATVPGHVGVTWADLGLPTVWAPGLDQDAQLAAATFDRELDHAWRRTSYSAITADAASEHRVDSEPEEDVELDEEGVEEGPAAPLEDDPSGLRAVPSLLADMPGGTHVGSLLHEVLETVEFDAEDLAVEVAARLAEGRVRRPVDVGSDAAVVGGLCAALTTPLGPLAGERSLRSLARADRIDEMNFELPLVGGVDATGSLTAAALGEALQAALPTDDPLHAYGARLGDPTLWRELRGYLTGSIDLVFRVPGADGRTAYGIADYKTNRLGTFGTPLTLFDYRASALRAEMYRSHYALQGLLYTVALHRFLRWRVADYDPDTDIAGVFYLFLRGMAGPETPRDEDVPCGVFAWRPPAGLVTSLSDLLDEGGSSS